MRTKPALTSALCAAAAIAVGLGWVFPAAIARANPVEMTLPLEEHSGASGEEHHNTAPARPAMDDEAQRIYKKYGGALYQIQVIDIVTEKKTSIGSGFQFTADGKVATNYHVIADALQRPDANRLEFVHDHYGTGKLKLLIADVRHDLAILQLEQPHAEYVELGKSDLPKGVRLYSLGNPHDIGFTIVEGTYNGVSRDSFIDKIHFSGAVNPGMSGGPVLGHDGKVAGINVMTAGNQIGFLVPVEPLKALADEYAAQDASFNFTKDAAKLVEAQLVAAQDAAQERLMNGDWNAAPFGRVSVPGRIDTAFKCWAAQRHTEKSPYTHYRTTCSTEDSLYLDEGFTTGSYVYSYDLIRARKGFGSLRFYSLYEQLYTTPESSFFSMNVQEKDAENFACQNRFVTHGGQRWKASFCARQYKRYPALFDTMLYMAQLGQSREGLIVSLGAQGITKDNALQLTQRFMQSLTPVPVPEDTPALPIGVEDAGEAQPSKDDTPKGDAP